MFFIFQILLSLALMIVAYLIAPKPKQEAATPQDQENPTASAGTPAPVIFGTLTVKNPNVLWYGDKQMRTYSVKA